MLRPLAYLLFLTTVFSFEPPQNWHRYQINGRAQGTTYAVTYFASDSIILHHQLDSILDVIDSSMSLYKPYSVINAFNNSKRGCIADPHLRKVIEKSLLAWKQTSGLFDITVMRLVKAWGFGPNTSSSIPDSVTIRKLVQCTGSSGLQLKGDSLVKSIPCLAIDVNGIAQGYSVDVLASYLESSGINNYLIELGGEIRIKGRKQPGNEKMKIGIEAPSGDEVQMSLQKVLEMDEGAITTSGNYRRYYESNGKHISHLIDPRTGFPVQNELISVTVFASDAITADAFDNALMLMGLEEALNFTEQHENIAAYFIYRRPDHSIADTCSRKFRKLLR
jgi:thiamine biosynthesis lipoprotein